MRRCKSKEQNENEQKDSCAFYGGGKRCSILNAGTPLICGYKRCTLYKPRGTEVDNAERISGKAE